MWYLSTRVIRRVGEPEWADYINFLGLPHLGEVRSIDSWCNPHVEGSGNYLLERLEQVEDVLDLLPLPNPGQQYYLLFTDALKTTIPQQHPRLKF